MNCFKEVVLLIVVKESIDTTIDEMIREEYYPVGIVFSSEGRIILPLIKFNLKFLA